MSQAKILAPSEFRKILLHIAKKKHHARNKAIVYCSFFGCMRVGEIASLTIKDVLAEDGSIKEEVYLKAYIEGLVKQIDVCWNEAEREHELTLTFHLPIVNDGITWREKENYEGHGRRARRYDTYEGSTKTTLFAKKKDGRG